MELSVRKPLILYYSKASLKLIDTNLIHQNFLLYVSGKCFVLDGHCSFGPVVFRMRFTVLLDHRIRGKGGTINTTEMSKAILD